MQRRAVAVAQVPVGLVPQPRDRLAPQQGGAEPGPLLVAERHHLHRERQPVHPVAQPLEHLDGHEDAEHAVEAAGVGDGVDVRAEHERRQAGAAALAAAPLVAGGVLPGGGGAGRPQPLGHRLVGPRVLGREVGALQDSGPGADQVEVGAALEHPRGVGSVAHPAYTSCAAPVPPPAVIAAPAWRSTCSRTASVVSTASRRAFHPIVPMRQTRPCSGPNEVPISMP